MLHYPQTISLHSSFHFSFCSIFHLILHYGSCQVMAGTCLERFGCKASTARKSQPHGAMASGHDVVPPCADRRLWKPAAGWEGQKCSLHAFTGKFFRTLWRIAIIIAITFVLLLLLLPLLVLFVLFLLLFLLLSAFWEGDRLVLWHRRERLVERAGGLFQTGRG